jgi:hypothetical protein
LKHNDNAILAKKVIPERKFLLVGIFLYVWVKEKAQNSYSEMSVSGPKVLLHFNLSPFF